MMGIHCAEVWINGLSKASNAMLIQKQVAFDSSIAWFVIKGLCVCMSIHSVLCLIHCLSLRQSSSCLKLNYCVIITITLSSKLWTFIESQSSVDTRKLSLSQQGSLHYSITGRAV